MEKTMLIPMERFGAWNTFNLIATKDLGDGTCLLASITRSIEFADIDENVYCTVIYRADYDRYGQFADPKRLKLETFSNIWDALTFCETVGLGEIETTNG